MLSTIRFGLRCAAVLFAALLALPVAAQAHKSRGYSHDEGAKTSNTSWMTALKDSVLLSELSIPGTHDSMARYGSNIPKAQTMTLEQQLDSGIRLIDIRCWHVLNTFEINHGPVYQGTNLGDVLKTVVGFLVNHPGETVVMRIKEEFTDIQNTESFEKGFTTRYWNNYIDYFYHEPSNNPPLSLMRGKIVLLENFSDKTYGIHYDKGNGFDIQDDFHLDSNADLYNKWQHVKAQLKQANDGDTNVKFINFLSGSGGSFPYFVASGHFDPGTSSARLATGRTTPGWKSWKDFPRVNCAIGICTIAYEGTNVLTYDRLGHDYKKRVGLLFADFPGPGLIERTIALNDRFKK
jgi:1-phosphatidylinositol phosphodiesterase